MSGFARHLDYGWSTLHEPLDFQPDTPLSVETLVYSIDRGGKLVWASTSRGIKPRELVSLIGEVTAATAKEMFQPPAGPMYDYGPSHWTGDTDAHDAAY